MAGGLFDGRDAGVRGCAVDQHGAGAALTKPAPELRTVQSERIAQDIKERLGRIPGLDSGGTAVDLQPVLRHEASPSLRRITVGSYHTPLLSRSQLKVPSPPPVNIA